MNRIGELLSFLGLGVIVTILLVGMVLSVRDTFRFIKKLFARERGKKAT